MEHNAPKEHRVAFEPRFEVWRREARALLEEGISPGAVLWQPQEAAAQIALFGDGDARPAKGQVPRRGAPRRDAAKAGSLPTVPKAFLSLAKKVSCHRDGGRWNLLYRALWRITRGGEKNLLAITVDPDVHRLTHMAKAVRRDMHKMKAFVRFRRVVEQGDEWFIAWHRPDHYIIQAVAPFFEDRFNDQRWSILTPDASAHWNLREVRFGPGVPRTAAPERDVLEDLWRDYYASIFNPARLNLQAMRAEMPVKHWSTLPEAELLTTLMKEAPARQQSMLKARRRPPARTFFPAIDEAVGGPGDRLGTLARAVQECRACSLCELGTTAVFGEGPAHARLVLVGEQPGDQEEKRGRPFVGPAGALLNEALEEAGLLRDQLYLTNSVKHFRFEARPGSRGIQRIHKTPGLTEVRSCKPWLEEELRIVRPQGIVCLGSTAAKALMPPGFRVTRDRGQVHQPREGAWTLGTYHPAALLRHPDEEKRAQLYAHLVGDLRKAAELISGASALLPTSSTG